MVAVRDRLRKMESEPFALYVNVTFAMEGRTWALNALRLCLLHTVTWQSSVLHTTVQFGRNLLYPGQLGTPLYLDPSMSLCVLTKTRNALKDRV